MIMSAPKGVGHGSFRISAHTRSTHNMASAREKRFLEKNFFAPQLLKNLLHDFLCCRKSVLIVLCEFECKLGLGNSEIIEGGGAHGNSIIWIGQHFA